MPGVYPRRKRTGWYLTRTPYRIFMLRELSSIFIAGYVVLLLVLVQKVRSGQSAFEQYLDFLQSPLLIVAHVIVLLFALLHTVTWFQAVPKAMPVKLGVERVPDRVLMGGIYALWAGASAVVLVVFLI